MTNFEKQQNIFNEFVENTQDRFDAIIKDGINLVFDTDHIIFDNFVILKYSIKNLLPELIFIDSVNTPDRFNTLLNIMHNYSELCSVIKEYITLYTHMQSFKDMGLSTDDCYNMIKDGIDDIIRNSPEVLNDKMFFIKNELYNMQNFNIMLKIISYGGAKKINVNMQYLMVHPETGEETLICDYKIPKPDMSSDIAYQVSNNICKHIPAGL